MKKLKHYFHFFKIYFYFLFIPSFLYKIYNGSRLMSNKERVKYSENVYEDFLIYKHPIICDEINIILKGESFNKNSLINRSLPTFVVNPSNNIEYNKNDIFVTSDGGLFEKHLNDKLPIFFISGGHMANNEIIYREFYFTKNDFNNYLKIKHKKLIEYLFNNHINLKIMHHSKTYNLQISSSLTSIIFLSKLSKKTNIYGWDIYLDKISIKQSNVFTNILLFFKNSGTYRYDIYNNFSSAILNTYYAYRLNKLNNVLIYGHIKFFFNKINLLKRIEKIIYKL